MKERNVFLILALAAPAISATRLRIVHGMFRKGRSSAQEVTVLVDGGERATLADYCVEGGNEPSFQIQKDQYVEADWGNYGMFYPGKITKVHKNGTVDILYDDGWNEKRVDMENVRMVDGKEKEKKEKKENKPDDAACEFVDKLEDVKKKVDETERDVNLYMTTKEAQRQGVERPKLPPRPKSRRSKAPPAPAPAPATWASWWQPPAGLIPFTNSSSAAASPEPAPASPTLSEPISKEKSEKLEKLREELSDLDETIRGLREEIEENDKLITGEWEDEEDLDDDGVLSIDDLIQQFHDRIAERKEELKRLKARRREQDAQLARVGASPVTLEQIQVHSKEILFDIEDMKSRRDKLEKEDKLDPELGCAMDDLIAQGEALDSKISRMIEAEKRAEKFQKAAEAARREAAEVRRKAAAAAKKAREDMERKLLEEAHQRAAKSADPSKTMREAFSDAKKKSRRVHDDTIAVDEAVIEHQQKVAEAQEAAATVANNMAFQAADEVRGSLDVMKSGTQGMDTGVHPNGNKWWRYRYEHSFIEGLLAMLVSFFVMCWEYFIRNLRLWIFRASRLQHVEVHARQSLYQNWLDHFLIEMVACLLMFLTVWLIGHLGFFDQLPIIFTSHSKLHLPTTGHQYRVLAYEMCVILTSALILYFCLALSVVRAATDKLSRWPNKMQKNSDGPRISNQLTLGGADAELHQLRIYFIKYITLQDPEALDVRSFEFLRYLIIAVRGTIDSMLIFGPLRWIAVLWTFGVFLVLHAYAHVAFIRITTFFLAVLFVTLASMAWAIVSVNGTSAALIEQFIDRDERAETPAAPKRHPNHQSWIIFASMTYALFFLCYGTARTLLQPWLWKLYFYTLLFVAGFSLFMCLVFIFAIAPLIPTYGASVKLPPYVDVAYVKSLKEALQDEQLRS